MNRAPSIHPLTLGLFEKRIEGDDCLLELARQRFHAAGMSAEMSATTPEQLDWIMQFRPFNDVPVVAHLPRNFNLTEEDSRHQIEVFAHRFASRLHGLVIHDHQNMAAHPRDYLHAAQEMNARLQRIKNGPWLFVEYAVGLELETFVNFFEAIRPLDRISACVDIGHVGIQKARKAYSASHQGEDICALKSQPERIPQAMPDIEKALATALPAVLGLVEKLGTLGKPVHFHLHDGHPLSTYSPFGVADHLSFLAKIPLDFKTHHRQPTGTMFGRDGLFQIVAKALQVFGRERVSFTLEIHPLAERQPLGAAAPLFNHWRDKTNAERTNCWLSVLEENHHLLREAIKAALTAEHRSDERRQPHERSVTMKTSHSMDELVAGLNKLSRNLWWSWDQEAQDIFQELTPRGWQNLYHNAAAVLHEVSESELRARLQDSEFADRVRTVLRDFENYLSDRGTWGHKNAPKLHQNPVAYFSAEFGFHESLPIAAGGLGILAGDHAKSASDLGLGFVGLGLYYHEGYFQQAIDTNNWQTEYYNAVDPKNVPVEPVLDASGERLVCHIGIGLNPVKFQVWRVNVGRVPVYLLDTNLPSNEQFFRDLTSRVYGGDSTTRIMQEVLLGIGGVRLLRALGIEPSTFHMNEGHAAFLTLELLREKLAAGKPAAEALALTKSECIFTTHTPVEAGHDRFNVELMNYALQKFQTELPLPFKDVLALGRVHPDNKHEPFCMTVLALKLSRAANAVSELHGQVSRHMWQHLYNVPEKDVPIGHITNGIHLLGWMKGTVRHFWRRKLTGTNNGELAFFREKFGEDWASAINHASFWEKMTNPHFVSDEELWALRYKLRRELIEFARRRLMLQSQRVTPGDYIRFDHLLNPDALTIGFARRFATYKRAPLIFQQFDNIVKLVRDKQRPVQFIFAGKAHPRDDDGKRFIQQIIHLSKHSELAGHLVFLENYDVHVARQMVAGCDVWLNNPRRPLEASGTSGMKASCHGCLNLSILDGWWREGYDGTNGFAIGEDSQPNNIKEQDRVDSANLYNTLTKQVVPMFFDRDANNIPRLWIQLIRRAMMTLVPQFTTDRMVKDYTRNYYLTGQNAAAETPIVL
jgi:glycogen phosphorylase